MAIKFETGEPVKGFPIAFKWAKGTWKEIFEKHIALIRRDLQRAYAEDRLIVYLSCPISSRGGAHFRTNVDIANFTTRRLLTDWGDRFFVLNPAAYQLESKEGTGLIMRHVEELFPKDDPAKKLAQLKQEYSPGGGDYMRMWTCVLVQDDSLINDPKRKGLNCGGLFDVFYFLGPRDVQKFFAQSGGVSLTASVEEFFARQHAVDAEFRSDFEAVKDKSGAYVRSLDAFKAEETVEWTARRKNFFRYYSVRASAAYSLGSHDEWNIFIRLNERRRKNDAYGGGEQIAGYFDGHQIDPAASVTGTSAGYEATDPAPGAPHPGEVSWPARLNVAG